MNKEIDLKVFASRLTFLLDSTDETIYSLAEKLSLTASTISRYQNGLMKPKLPTVLSMANIFNVNDTWLMGYDVPMEKVSNLVPLKKVRYIPLLGRIACGEPILAEVNIEGKIVLPDEVNADFALTCRGDSMIDARIFNGDIVYIKQQPIVENGEIAAVLIGDEATLKRVYKQGDTVILKAENAAMEPMVYTKSQLKDLKIIGKAVWFLSEVK